MTVTNGVFNRIAAQAKALLEKQRLRNLFAPLRGWSGLAGWKAALAVAVVLGALLVVSAALVARPTPHAPVRRTFTVKQTSLPVSITEVGQLEPREYEVVSAPISGILVEMAKEGASVRKDEMVARMNDDDARDELEYQQILIKNREAMLRKAEIDLQQTTKDLEYQKQIAQVQLDLAELDLKELRVKPAATVAALSGFNQSYWRLASDAAKKLADLDVEYGRLAEETSKKKFDRQKLLAEKGVASENDMADARLKYEKDRTVHENATIIRELLQKGTPEGDIETAREKVKQARVKLEQVQKSAQAQMDLKKTAIAVAQAELNRSRESLENSRRILESVIVKAPAEGTVLYWGPWTRPRPGDYLWNGNGFMSITQMGRMNVLTRVNEVDVRRIGLGQQALVRLEAIPGSVYHGKVVWMAGLATDRDERSQGVIRKDLSGVMVFEVTIEIEERDPDMRPTMSGTVEIIVDELRDAIVVPYDAVIERDGATFVRLLDNDAVTEQEVVLGASHKSGVIVTKGLRDGDVLCLN